MDRSLAGQEQLERFLAVLGLDHLADSESFEPNPREAAYRLLVVDDKYAQRAGNRHQFGSRVMEMALVLLMT